MANGQIRPIRIDGNLAYVPLTKGYEAVIDAADVPLVEGYNWHAQMMTPTIAYAVRSDRPTHKTKSIRMHRVILGEPSGLEVDHIDCNGLNNQRANLRAATGSQNRHNQRLSKRNKSGFKGVSWRPDCGKWRAYINLDGARRYLGYFSTPEEAHAAYVSASKEMHGDFARAA